MDGKLIFWCWALANMALVLALGVRGARAIRANRVDEHRRAMTWAGLFVIAFLLAYVAKRALLGREDLSVWSPGARANLYVHEAFVAAMLLAGGAAFAWGRRLARTRRATGNAGDPPASPAAVARHRLAGRVALIAAFFGFLTASGVLAGMLLRA